MAVGQADVMSTSVNMVWIVFDLLVLSVVVRAALYRGYDEPVGESPAVEAGL